jgi:hypothetical protein
MFVGLTRMHYCDHCERETSQRLDDFAKTGDGKVVAERWRCLQCNQYVGDRPPKPPSDLEDLWDAS